MSGNNPLIPAYTAFEVARDCFRTVRRTLDGHAEDVSHHPVGAGVTHASAVQSLEDAERQVCDLAVLALWSSFERHIIERVREYSQWLEKGHPEVYARRLAKKFESEVEYWRIDDILDLFKGEINADALGQAKQIKRYRDWIAHRNPRRANPPTATPESAFTVLTEIINDIHLAHTPRTPAIADAA